jgi:hypothetical protein
MNARDVRIQEVHNHQLFLGMTPRNDSKLTEMYADGLTDMSAQEIARELMAVDYIYKCTPYSELIEEYMRSVAKKLRNKYKLSWTDTWDIVRKYAPSALKLQCLSATGERIPRFMPNQNMDTSSES